MSRIPQDAAPVVAFAATTATALLAAPAIAGQLASQFGLPPSAVGLYFTVEQTGMCLASVPAAWWLTRVSWRRVGAVAIGMFVLANLLSTQATQFGWLLPLRAMSSLSGGTLMVLSMTLAGRSAERERLFAFWTLGQLAVGSGLLFLLPRAFEVFGLVFLYGLLAVLAAANIPLLRCLPARPATPPAGVGNIDPGARRFSGRVLTFGVGGVLLYYIGYGGLWPFLAAIARSGGTDAIVTGNLLAFAGLAGLAGSLVAVAWAHRDGWSTLALGYGLHVAAVLTLAYQPAAGRFALAACLLKGASYFTLPFILGRVARLDRDGRLMGFVNMAIGGGLAIGPLISGQLIEGTGGRDVLIAVTLAWIAVSAWLVLSIGIAQRETRTASPGTAQACILHGDR